MQKAQLVLSALLLVLLLAACAPKAAPAPAAPQAPAAVPAAPAPAAPQAPAAVPAAPAVVPAAPEKAAWEVEWEKTVEAAKREGSVIFYTQGSPQARLLAKGFTLRFGIKSEFVSGTSNELSAKIVAERRAGLYLVDGTILGASSPSKILKPAGALDSLDKVLLLPELTDQKEIEKIMIARELEWIDKGHTLLAHARYVRSDVIFNTQLVRPGEITAYRDLLDPKWKGKIIMQDPTLGTGVGILTVQAVVHLIGWDYWGKLAEQKPLLTRDNRLLVDWVARGKYAIGVSVQDEVYNSFRNIGAPIQAVKPEEGEYTSGGSNVLTLLKNAPHPNSTKLFINWVFTKEGQRYFVEGAGLPALRADVPFDGPPGYIPDPKKRYLRSNSEEMMLELPEVTKRAREIFGKLVQ